MNVNFDSETHTYTDDAGTEYPSVTTIIKEVWPVDTRFYRSTASDRGTAIHEMTALIDSGLATIDDMVGEEQYIPIRSWCTFVDRMGGEFAAVEEPFIHPTLHYAGTIDRILKTDGEVLLLDQKNGASAAWHELQLGAYAVGARDCLGIEPDRAFVVYVPKEGGHPKPVEVDIRFAMAAWEGLMRWKLYRRSFK